MSPLRIGVIFGGRSGEHEVSLASAASVMSALERGGHTVVPIGIARDGRWVVGGDPLRALAAEARIAMPAGDVTGDVKKALADRAEATLGISDTALARTEPPGGLPAELRHALDVVVIMLHGPYGEDGTMQGQEIGFPCFVKPSNLGSSVGISKVRNAAGLGPAMEEAARYDRKVMVERAVTAREIEISVLGNDQPETSVPAEVRYPGEWYDYATKYADGQAQLVIPAPISPALTRRVRELAVAAFRAIDCAGMARVDFFLEGRRVIVNEINTIPGFTPTSAYARMWEAAGVNYVTLLNRLVHLALERHREKLQ
jgi:D-alanine-D-alanine ligase